MVQCDVFAQAHASRRSFIGNATAQGQALVAVADGRVLGFLVLNHAFFEQAFVALIAVTAGHRRKGVGRALLAAAEAACPSPKLFSSTNTSNLGAQALLSKAGFVRSGFIDNLDPDDLELVYFKRVR
ncbi:GNAT family N-acetyltransferase [Ideonella sp. BN130291]|nr:GNAT family N-acetyltransferase [Ideonella sp. BN130291]